MAKDVEESRFQRGKAGLSTDRQPVLLDFTPANLDPIPFRAVGWQKLDPDPLCQPVLNTLGDGLTVVKRGLIQDHQREAGGRSGAT